MSYTPPAQHTALFDSIFAKINASTSILLHCHPNADGDSVGSTLGLAHALWEMGKKVTIIAGDTPKPQYLSFLPGFDRIIQKTYFETNLAEYDLFLVLDASSKEMISSLAPVEFPESLTIICIDHHATHTLFGNINFVDSTYPATAQMIFDLLVSQGISLSHDAAYCLFLGMYTDTGGFQYSSTTAATFMVAAELVQKAPDFSKAIFNLQNSNTKGRIMFEGLVISHIKEWFDGRVAYSAVSHDEIVAADIPATECEAGMLSNKLKSVPGWDIGIAIIEKEAGKVSLSFRTRDSEKYDLTKIVTALGGGGHKGAAGAKLTDSMQNVLEKVQKLLATTYFQNPNL